MPNRLSQEIAPHLPYLRRYARALTGSQQSGDAHVTACLDAIVADPGVLDLADGAKVGLYRLFHELWSGMELDRPLPSDDGRPAKERTTRERLSEMTPEGTAGAAADHARGLPARAGGAVSPGTASRRSRPCCARRSPRSTGRPRRRC